MRANKIIWMYIIIIGIVGDEVGFFFEFMFFDNLFVLVYFLLEIIVAVAIALFEVHYVLLL